MTTSNASLDTIFVSVDDLETADQIRQSVMTTFLKQKLWLFVYEDPADIWNVSVANEMGGSVNDEVIDTLQNHVAGLIDLQHLISFDKDEEEATNT